MYRLEDVILDIADYIENSIYDNISLDLIASQVYLSKYHLNRVFKAMTGKGLMEYVRSRRLAASLENLMHTGLRVADISAKYGFEFESSYIRSFIREYGMSPTQFRKDKPSVAIAGKVDKSSLIPLSNGFVFKPSYVFKPEFHICGINHDKLSGEEVNKNNLAANLAIDFYYNRRKEIINAINPLVYIGFTEWYNLSRGYSCYITGLEVSDSSYIPNGMVIRIVPSSRYAVFRYIGFFHPNQLNVTHITDLWGYVFYNWLPQHNVAVDEIFSFEYIDMSLAREDYCELDLYVPVRV